jgi:hypothetical protein
VKARVVLLLKRNDLVSAAGEESGCGTPGRAATDHCYVTDLNYRFHPLPIASRAEADRRAVANCQHPRETFRKPHEDGSPALVEPSGLRAASNSKSADAPV